MAELNLKQITDKLNSELAGGERKLIFWYDGKGEFIEDIHSLALIHAKIFYLEADNQFYAKYFFERVDRDNSYLIYAPFPEPVIRENYIADIKLYSKVFHADRVSLLAVDLGVDNEYKPILEKYIRFFGKKDRTQKFYDLEIENYNKANIEVGLMRVICKTHMASFEEVVRVILTDGEFEENKFLLEFDKYELLPAFWQMCDEQFGFADAKPTIEKLVITMFITYIARSLHADLPKAWHGFVSYKAGNIIAFMDSLMNNILYRQRYDEISKAIEGKINAGKAFQTYNPEYMIDCDTFTVFDELMLNWLKERLLNEDSGAKLGSLDIPTICKERCKKHFGGIYQVEYEMMFNAFHMIEAAKYVCVDNIEEIVHRYLTKDYLLDSYYREFYYYYDKIHDAAEYEKLRDLVENIYTNEYLAKLLPSWNKALVNNEVKNVLLLQKDFFMNKLKFNKDKVVVIISDALRYEVGQMLWAKLQDEAKCTAQIEAMLGVLPSYTKLGMAALLPHRTLDISDDAKVLIDDMLCDDLKQREMILQKYVPNSRAVKFDDIKVMKREQLRQIFNGMDVVYVYHDQIDARGDKASTENEVFTACKEAVDEIYQLIKNLLVHTSTYHYMVTADHGFIYKRDKLSESDKIANTASKDAFVSRRFVIADDAIKDDGVMSLSIGQILGNDNQKVVSYPINSNIFKVAGGGQNYVHGGSSPQEMLVPIIDLKMERGHMETKSVEIKLVSMFNKITNLIVSFDFIQAEPISDIVKATSYKLFFVSEDNERISNECIYVADKKDVEPQKRIFRLRFNFKNCQYDKTKQYYMVAYDEKNDIEVFRHGVIMDIVLCK